MTDAEIKTGCLVVITSPDGYVQASVANFEQAHAAGFSVYEAQEMVAEKHAIGEIVKRHCSQFIADALNDGYLQARLWERLRTAGWRKHSQCIEIPRDQ